MLCSGAKFSYGISVGLADERDAKKSRNREGLWQAACFGEVVVHGSCLDAFAGCGASISARSRPDTVIGVTQTIVVYRWQGCFDFAGPFGRNGSVALGMTATVSQG